MYKTKEQEKKYQSQAFGWYQTDIYRSFDAS